MIYRKRKKLKMPTYLSNIYLASNDLTIAFGLFGRCLIMIMASKLPPLVVLGITLETIFIPCLLGKLEVPSRANLSQSNPP